MNYNTLPQQTEIMGTSDVIQGILKHPVYKRQRISETKKDGMRHHRDSFWKTTDDKCHLKHSCWRRE